MQLGFTPPSHGRASGSRATSGPWPTKVAALDEVDYVVLCAGSFDLLAELVCEDDDRLLAHLLNDSIRSIPGVRATETLPLPETGQADLHLGDQMSDMAPRQRHASGTTP